MVWANFLHIYQPADQYKDIIEAVVKQSYRPLLTSLKANPHAKINLNINASLTELLDKYGFHDILDLMRELGANGQIEFTGSAKFHAFLPLTPEKEIYRQIKINYDTNRYFLGEGYKPVGFFPPEMGYKPGLEKIIEELGYKWLLIDEIAKDGNVGTVDYSKTYKIKGSNVFAFFRERRLSNTIMAAVPRSGDTLFEGMKHEIRSGNYIITAMDGETFGHHRPGLEKLMSDILASKAYRLVGISELIGLYPNVEEISPVASNWASSKQDIDSNIQFLSWSDPANEIHTMQWDFLHFVLNKVHALDESVSGYSEIRADMDKCIASDHYWWASAKPWWGLDMITEAAYKLLSVLKRIPDVTQEEVNKGQDFCEKIVTTALDWQRSGKIRDMASQQNGVLRIPFKERTLETSGKENVYLAFIDMIRQLEKKAAEVGEYEKAILWRDAYYKLENKSDVYDAINAIDLVRVELGNEKVEEVIKSYEGKYKEIRGGQPEQRGS